MATPKSLYGHSLALLTDLYQLTMASAYWSSGMAERQAVFHLFFRENPFRGGFAIACGVDAVIDFIERFQFDDEDLAYLETLRGVDERPLFKSAFLDHLRGLKFACDVDALPEGTAVFPQEPLVRVRGPILQCQLMETPLLTLVNYSTLVATKAARLYLAADGDSILEFGLRRAQGIDGGVTAARAAYVGGCVATSNVLAGKLFGIPVRGTHAHSWVMAFDDEPTAFQTYAQAMPNNCVFLVDTYDTLDGVRHAVETGRWLQQNGHRMVGIRLDSGDMTALSIQARKILDDAGFPAASIVASSDLDEYAIAAMKERGARVDVWGVGTRLATAYDQPALGGVYKLTAIQTREGRWQDRVKRSEDAIKSTNPGIQQVRRFFGGDGQFIGDMIYDENHGVAGEASMIDLADSRARRTFPADAEHEDLLTPIFQSGDCVYPRVAIEDSRARTLAQLERLPAGVKRFEAPETYPVGLEAGLHETKTRLLAEVNRRRGSSVESEEP